MKIGEFTISVVSNFYEGSAKKRVPVENSEDEAIPDDDRARSKRVVSSAFGDDRVPNSLRRRDAENEDYKKDAYGSDEEPYPARQGRNNSRSNTRKNPPKT
jgi:hypothetical protein